MPGGSKYKICLKKFLKIYRDDRLTEDEKGALLNKLDAIVANYDTNSIMHAVYQYNRLLAALMQSKKIDVSDLMFTEQEVESLLEDSD